MKRISEQIDRMQEILTRPTPIPQAPEPNSASTLVILSGDISDVDGFFGLAKYAQTSCDVIFVMNYPAYLSETIPYSRDIATETEPGLGYDYGLGAVRAATESKFRSNANYRAYSILCSNATTSDPKAQFKLGMTELAFFMACKVWDSVTNTAKGKLYFCIGGVNSINPFHPNAIKNEVFVYSKTAVDNGFDDYPKLNCADEGTIFNQSGQKTHKPWLKMPYYRKVYLDFAGSMAFFNSTWSDRLEFIHSRARNISGCFVMGGVLSDKPAQTMPSIPNVLNRFSCATMNQLYHPEYTAKLFDFLRVSRISTFTVANNAVKDFNTVDDSNKATDDGWKKFIETHELDSSGFLTAIANAYYNSPYAPPPRKPFDFYTALAVTEHMARFVLFGSEKKLFYDSKYGATLVGPPETESFKDAVEQYTANFSKQLPERKGEDDAKWQGTLTFITNKIRSFDAESAILLAIPDENTDTLAVTDLQFIVNPSTREITLK